MSFVVAIDGTAGTGKGTVTKILAEKFNLANIDTGAMYRCVTLECIRRNILCTELEKIEKVLDEIKIEFKNQGDSKLVYLNDENVTTKIRTDEVNNAVSDFSMVKLIRDKITPMQRKMGELSDIIMEGRDIGTTVFPNANVKIYLDATPEERANRRIKQNIENGISNQSYEQILENIKNRDYLDSHREISPLKQAEDAIYIDTTNLSIDEVVEKISEIIRSKLNG